MVTKGNVLVVDDEINLCRILGAKLAKSGYSVVAVHDGQQAVEKVRESDFDVVLLDLILPKMDGLAALAEIRGMRRYLPVIVMTACENAEAMAQAKSYGVSAYINKPFDLDNLVSLVSNTSLPRKSTSPCMPDATVLFCTDQPVNLEIQNGSHSRACRGWIRNKDERTLTVIVRCPDDETGAILPRSQVKVGMAAIDAFYSFTTQILKTKTLEAPERLLTLDKPSVIYRLQRRQHPRLALRVPAAYGICGNRETEPESLIEAETLDISMGGVSLAVREEIAAGKIVKIELRPKTVSDVIHAMGRVVRSGRMSVAGQYDYVLACKFTSVDESLHSLLEY